MLLTIAMQLCYRSHTFCSKSNDVKISKNKKGTNLVPFILLYLFRSDFRLELATPCVAIDDDFVHDYILLVRLGNVYSVRYQSLNFVFETDKSIINVARLKRVSNVRCSRLKRVSNY